MKKKIFCPFRPELRWASRSPFFDNSGSRNGWSEALVAGVCGVDAQRNTGVCATPSPENPQATQPYRPKLFEQLFGEQMLIANR